ncbi:MAG: LapA family protein [Nitriliruptor sp.]|nr:MAG: LapA family protein [Nitriliruptor sp.]
MPFTQQLGRVTIVVLAVLFGVFAVANSQRVDFSWIFGETTVREGPTGEVTGGVPLILLLVGAFVAGAVIAILTELHVTRVRRARKATAERGKGQDKGRGKDKGKDKDKGRSKDQRGKDEGGGR